MNRVKRFFSASVQIVWLLASIGGIVLSVIRVWQGFKEQAFGHLWAYGLLFIVCAYMIGLIMDRHHFDLSTVEDGEGGFIVIVFIVGIIIGGFVYYLTNATMKRLFWILRPDQTPPPDPDKPSDKKGEIIPFRKK